MTPSESGSTSAVGRPSDQQLAIGVAFALATGLLWGIVFVAPVWMPDYPPAMLTFGRYLAFGLIALLIVYPDRQALRAMHRADWIEATKLSIVGNLAYYGCLAAAIQIAGAPLPTMLIGTLPLVIAVFANLAEPSVRWRQLVVPLSLIGAGLLAVHAAERQGAMADTPPAQLLTGTALAIGAVACWTWYPIRNARWLKARQPDLNASTWATAQGLATLPLALVGYLLTVLWYDQHGGAQGISLAEPFGPRPWVFIGLMLAIGLLASWLGTLMWNQASRRLPTALTGQLIVFETLSALLYAYLVRGTQPEPIALLGIALLIIGVLRGVRIFR